MSEARAGEGKERTVRIPVAGRSLVGDLVVPEGARGLVLFAHGSGSSRRSPRHRQVAETLHDGGLATLLFDLLTEEEERIDLATAELRFDVPLLADRLLVATGWIRREPSLRSLRIGYFGSSTGAAAALAAAARRPDQVVAVVSRGGRPDLAGDALPAVRASTLLLVGGADRAVVALNRAAYDRLCCDKRLSIVARATHLFEEEGALEEVAAQACGWFTSYLTPSALKTPAGEPVVPGP